LPDLGITNSADSIITLDNAWKIYKLRWQIELIFKIWKSICKIDKVKKVKEERLECYIFSKLILIVSGWRITWQVANWLYKKEQKALSFFKAFKTLIREQMEDLKGIFVLSNKCPFGKLA
jgi:prolipoprotein diacylglyceryltransferase